MNHLLLTARNSALPIIVLGIAGALALSFSATAQADAIDGIIDTWQVDVSTIFDTASICDSTGDCTAPTGVTVIDNQTLRWGSSTGQGVSGLQISNSPARCSVLPLPAEP